MKSSSRRVTAERQMGIEYDETYAEMGTQRKSVPRFGPDKSNFRNAGNGMANNLSTFKHGADPPKNESGGLNNVTSYARSSRYEQLPMSKTKDRGALLHIRGHSARVR